MLKDWELFGLRCYRQGRKSLPPLQAAEGTARVLWLRADSACRQGLHDAESSYRQHAEYWGALADLIQARKDTDTRRGRYWMTGKLSDLDDVYVWIAEGDRYVTCQSRCKSLGCALKHARTLFATGRATEVGLYDRNDNPMTGMAKSAAELEMMVRELVG